MFYCPHCQCECEQKPENCSHCGFPFEASSKEKALFIGQQISKKNKFSETKDKIKRARYILWIIGALTVAQYFISLGSEIEMLLGILFIGFGFLTYVRPLPAILIPFVLLLASYVLMAFTDLGLLFQGIVFKLIFLFGLGYSLVMIMQTHKIKKESAWLKLHD